MNRFRKSVSTFVIFLLISLVLAQEISGRYVAEHELGQMVLTINQLDGNITAQMTDGNSVGDLVGVLENDTLIFYTGEFPYSIKARLVEDKIEMIISQGLSNTEDIELTFEHQELPKAARAPQNALTQLLEFVPATPENYTSEIFYTNLWALSGFRNAGIIQSQQEFVDLRDSEYFDTYFKNTFLLSAMPFDKTINTDLLPNMQEIVGFSWFDIQTFLNYGTRPDKGYLALTSANQANISNALENLDYEEKEFQNHKIWVSGEEGELNFETRNPANPFDGNLGMPARVVRIDNVIGYAHHDAIIHEQVRSYSQGTQSLAQLPGVAFLASQLEATDDVLFQAYYPPLPSLLNSLVDPAAFLVADTPLKLEQGKFIDKLLEMNIGEEQKVLYDAIVSSERQLPLPQQIAFAHYFQDDSDYSKTYATLSLLYSDLEAAQDASDILFQRLTLYHQPFETIEVQPATVVSSVSGDHHVLSVRVENLDQSFDTNNQPIEPFRRWITSLYRSEFLPLYFF